MTLESRLADLRTELAALKRTRSTDEHASDPTVFAEQALALDLDAWQKRVLSGAWSRVLLNVTRQGGKSTVAAILALHQALFHPGSLTLVVSPSLRQSSELFRSVCDLRERLPWPVQLDEDNRLSMRVAGGGRIVSLPGSERTIRGHSSVSLLIEDEAARVPDELYLSVRPMLAISSGRLALLSTPWGQRGHFFEAWQSTETWERVRVPATDCPRISPDFLEEERQALGARWFNQEYMCEFEASEDTVFRRAEIDAAYTSDVTPLFGAG